MRFFTIAPRGLVAGDRITEDHLRKLRYDENPGYRVLDAAVEALRPDHLPSIHAQVSATPSIEALVANPGEWDIYAVEPPPCGQSALRDVSHIFTLIDHFLNTPEEARLAESLIQDENVAQSIAAYWDEEISNNPVLVMYMAEAVVVDRFKNIEPYATDLSMLSQVRFERYGTADSHRTGMRVHKFITRPDREQVVGYVYVNGQIMTLWERMIPHKWGVANGKNPFIWLCYGPQVAQISHRLSMTVADAVQTARATFAEPKLNGALAEALELLRNEKLRPAENGIQWIPWTEDVHQPISWGFSVQHEHTCEVKNHGRMAVSPRNVLTITCNGQPVYQDRVDHDPAKAAIHAAHLIERMRDPMQEFDFSAPYSNIGKAVWYRDQPAVVDGVILADGAMRLISASGEPFKLGRPYDDPNDPIERDSVTVAVPILSDDVHWNRPTPPSEKASEMEA